MSHSSGPPEQSEFSAGTVIAGKYELCDVVGEGGMARIWRARDLKSGQEIAIKFVGSELENDMRLRRRFEREAKLLARIGEASEHVVRIVDYGVAPGGAPFLAMELLRGETLAARLRRRQRLTAKEVVGIVDQLREALGAAHAAGVVHRDIKPANIFLHQPAPDTPETVKLLDFGIAKVRVDSDLTVPTRAGTLLGTPDYMSPEQFLGDTTLDLRADLWSLGVVVYRMLVGRAPFSHGPKTELAARILGQEPSPPSRVVPSLPAELDVWIKKALAKRAEDRFADVESMALALTRALPSAAIDEIPPEARPRERHAKGVNLIELVKLLRIARREGKLGDLAPDDQSLLEERILVSSWYPIGIFWRLLSLAYERVLESSDENAIELGVAGAERVMASVHSVFVKGQDLERVLKSFERGWARYFDFGSVQSTLDGDVVRVTIQGYPDIPRVHGLTTLGWFRVALSLVGSEPRYGKIVREPWAGAEALVYEFGLGKR